ncbi:MAG: NnrU family protein [Gammaproteobacteria bacterium]
MPTSSLIELLAAAVLFTGGHFLLSAPHVRARLVAILGEPKFLAIYSVIMLLTFGWLIVSYLRAPIEPVWTSAPWTHGVALGLMPFAFILLVGGLRPDNPTAVASLSARANRAIPGFFAITRHPFLWAVTLWSIAHLLANGDRASIVLFGSQLILALFGTVAIDGKRRRRDPQRWRQLASETSNLPFAAIVAGRAKLAPRALLWPVALGLALYVLFLAGHHWLFGVSPL